MPNTLNYQQKSEYISRILSPEDYFICDIDDSPTILKARNLTASEQSYIKMLYDLNMRQAEDEEIPTQDEVLAIMIERKAWSKELEDRINSFDDDIENQRNVIRTNQFLEKLVKTSKMKIDRMYKERAHLLKRRHMLTYPGSQEQYSFGVCEREKLKMTLSYPDGSLLDSMILHRQEILDSILETIAKSTIEESIIREIARSSPWRIIWNSAKKNAASIVDFPLSRASNIQLSLFYWSNVYDNVFEHPESPSDDIVSDDEALDTWLDNEHSKNSDKSSNAISAAGNLSKHQEVMIPADKEGSKKVYAANPGIVREAMVKRQQIIDDAGKNEQRGVREEEITTKLGRAIAPLFVQNRDG